MLTCWPYHVYYVIKCLKPSKHNKIQRDWCPQVAKNINWDLMYFLLPLKTFLNVLKRTSQLPSYTAHPLLFKGSAMINCLCAPLMLPWPSADTIFFFKVPVTHYSWAWNLDSFFRQGTFLFCWKCKCGIYQHIYHLFHSAGSHLKSHTLCWHPAGW